MGMGGGPAPRAPSQIKAGDEVIDLIDRINRERFGGDLTWVVVLKNERTGRQSIVQSNPLPSRHTLLDLIAALQRDLAPGDERDDGEPASGEL